MRFIIVFLIFFYTNTKNTNANIISDVEQSLNSIRTIEAKIIQTDSKNDNAKGFFYLKKPNKMRIEYKNSKDDIIMVASKQFVTYYDKNVDETSHIPTNSTPATILMQEKIDFNEFEIVDCEEKNNIASITFYRKNNKDDGIFTFSFKRNDEGMFVIQRIDKYSDISKTQRVSILFINTKIDQPIDDKIFVLKDKRLNI